MMRPPSNPSFADEVRQSFAKQAIMGLIGGELTRVEPGVVEITLPYRTDLTQQDNFVHAGIIATIADSARSEEHTSELQSQSNLVCRLLLEKKNKSGGES